MHLKMLCCKIIEREVSLLAASSRNVVDVTMIRQKLHDKPENLNRFLQSEIDEWLKRGAQKSEEDLMREAREFVLSKKGKEK